MPALAYGQTLSFIKTGKPHFTLPQEKGVAYAIFRRLDDLWIVSDAVNTPLVIDASVHHAEEKGFILEQEELYVPNGQGVRLRFEKLKGIHVKKTEDRFEVYLTPQSGAEDIRPLAASLFEEGTKTKVKATLGSGQMVRATSFLTGESYLALTTYLNRGQAEIRTEGAVRQLKAHVGAVFVSSQGLPIGFEQDGEEVTFIPMKDALSRAVTYSRYRVPPSLVEELLDALNKTQQEIAHRPERVKTGFDVLLPALSGTEEASYAEALSQMQAALDRVAALQTVRKRSEDTQIQTDDVPQVALNPLEEVASITEAEVEEAPLVRPEIEHGHMIFINFGNLPTGEYARVEHKLKQEWIFAKTRDGKQKSGETLAAYYLFRGLYPEALGVLGNLGMTNTSTVRTLKAAANVLLGRFEDAQRIFVKEEKTPDEALWYAAAKYKAEPEKAYEVFAAHEDAIALYPPSLSQALRYYYAATLKEKGLLPEALTQLDQIALLEGGSRFLAKAQLLMAKVYEAQNQLDQAEQIYIALASHHDREVANFALLYFMNLLTEQRQLSPQDAIVRYENLRFLWRGDEVEEESLFRLADLYTEVFNYRLALERLQSLVTHFPESKYITQATERMTKIFEGVMMGRLEDPNLDTLAFLALYYDFRELTPAGSAGDELVTRVADKLAGLGLYKRATDILERQRNFRITDPQAIALLGYKLAQIYAQSFAPDKGLAVLQKTQRRDTPASLSHKRALAEAALFSLAEEPAKALDIAKKVPNEEGKMAQALYGWEVGDMDSIIHALDDRFKSVGGADWSDEDVTQFLALASALSARRKYSRLEELYNNYRPGLEAHGLKDDVLFFLQAANRLAQAPVGVQMLKQGAGFWAEAAKAMDEQNEFNRKYSILKRRWATENANIRASEEKALEEDLRGIR